MAEQPEDYSDSEAKNYGGKQLGKCAARNFNTPFAVHLEKIRKHLH